ncbi:MAG: hypothetical protein AAGF89_04105 [Bacteroidota bacterium]
MSIIPKKYLGILTALLLAVLFTACDEDSFVENIEPVIPEIAVEDEMPKSLAAALPPDDPTTASDRNDGRRGCFRFVFPINVELADGTVLTAESNEDLREIVSRLSGASLGANFVYPFDVVLANDATVSIANFENFRRLQALCMERDGGNPDRPCFRYNFPIDLSVDGETVTVNNGEDWRRAITAAGEDADVSIVFPISVDLPLQNEPLVLESQEELNRLRRRCADIDNDRPCIRYIYPIDLTIGDRTVTVNNLEEWIRARRDAADEGLEAAIVFPIKVVFRGERIELENEQQLRRIRNICNEITDRPCFRFIFPLDLNVGDQTVTVSSLQEWREILMDAGEEEVSITFPIDVVFRGDRISLDNAQQLRRVRTACEEETPDRPCFRYVFPVNLSVGEETVTVNNLAEWVRARQAAEEAGLEAKLIFPITVVFRGERLELANANQLRRLRNACQIDDEDRPCFRFIYPIDLTVGDRTVTVNNAQQWRRVIHAAGEETEVNIVFPIRIVFRGERITIENQRQLRRAQNACRDDDNERPCFRYVFPIDLTDGERTITVDNILEWRRARQAADEAGLEVSIVFPIKVVFRGELLTLENRVQLHRVMNACEEEEPPSRCFRYNFPVTLQVGEEAITVNNAREWARARRAAGEDVDISIVLPVTVTIIATEEEITVTEPAAWAQVRAACE